MALSTNFPCPYAKGLFHVFPKGFEKDGNKDRDIGEGSIEVCNDYVIYFKPGVSQETKSRIIKDYGEFYNKRRETLTF